MRWNSDRQRLAGVLGADRVSPRKTGLADLGRHATLEPAGAHQKRWGKRLYCE